MLVNVHLFVFVGDNMIVYVQTSLYVCVVSEVIFPVVPSHQSTVYAFAKYLLILKVWLADVAVASRIISFSVFDHFAYKVWLQSTTNWSPAFHILFRQVSDSYHHNKKYPVFVAVGNTIISHEFADIEFTELHPFVSNVSVKSHVHAGVTNQLSATPHLHGWLSENVSISDDGVVIHATKSDTFLFIV